MSRDLLRDRSGPSRPAPAVPDEEVPFEPVRRDLLGRGQPLGPRGPRRRSLWRRIVAAILVVVMMVLGCLGFLVTYAAFTLPSMDGISAVTGTLRILDRNGALIAEVGDGSTSHATVTLSQVSPIMQQAIIAAEDRQFYAEGPVNASRILKALLVDVMLRRPAEGASTITQQLARNAFLPQDKSALRKLREALLADEIDQRYGKDKILEMYLNTIYFGHGAWGIEEAAEAYFGVHAKDLTLAQSALLAGLPQAPSADDPYGNPQGAFSRMHYVLDGLVSMGTITQSQADAADPLVGSDSHLVGEATALTAQRAAHQQAIIGSLHDGRRGGTVNAPHFVEYVRDQLAQLFQNDPQALDGTLTIQTTLDLGIQQRAQQAVAAGVATIGRNANNGALLMLDAHTGGIIAMVGSADYNNNAIAGEFNIVTAQRQPGSSFKPYVYEEAFRDGALTPSTTLDDTPSESQKLGGVNDWDGRFMGPMPAWRALLLSRNVPTEQAMERAGPENVINFAHSLGITSDLADNASTGIGTSAVRMIDHAAAYAAFANGGTTVQPTGILKVSDQHGNVLYDAGTRAGTPVMTPQQAYAVTGILRQYNNQWHDGINRDIAAKSGTTDNYVDAWFMAYTPDWVVATWAGHTSGTDQSEVGMDTVYGNDVGHDIAAPFINGLPPSSRFSVPPGSPSYGGGGGGGGGGPVPAPAGPAGKHHGHG